MHFEKIYIKDLSDNFRDSDAHLEIYRLDYMDAMKTSNEKYPCPGLIVCPGGGYGFTSDREAEPIALRFLLEGFNTFVLRYTCEAKYPTPHNELAFFMDYLRKNYKKYDLTNDNISLIGFSAGGHLVGSYSYLYKEIGSNLNLNIANIKPLSIVLAYPVILMNKETHLGTKRVITNNEDELIDKMSIEKHIDSEYPPTYIFTTIEDSIVPPINTSKMVEKLEEHHVVYKSHIFDIGEHGGSLFLRSVFHPFTERERGALPNRVWLEEASDFMFSILKKK